MLKRSALILLMLILFTQTAAGSGISVTINGTTLEIEDSEPILVEGRVLVPVRAIFNALGATVQWMSRTRTVLGQGSDSIVVITIDSYTAEVYSCSDSVCTSRPVALDVPAQIIDGRTLVPLRFISESLGAQVGYDSANKVAYVNGYSQAPPQPTWQFQQLINQHEQAGITKPGPKPPNLAHYTFGHGPIGIAVTSHQILQSIASGGSYLEPPPGHQWLLVRVSAYNHGDQIHTVNPEHFYITAGGHTIHLSPNYKSLEDHFTSVHLASSASSGGLLLFGVPSSSLYRLRLTTDSALIIDIAL